MRRFEWKQVGGDVNPGTYGGLIARSDGDEIELIEIQPVREYVGDGEAAEVGFPFWTRTAIYDVATIFEHPELPSALRSVGLDLDDVEPAHQPLAAAEVLLSYGADTEEGNSGWAEDVLPSPMRVKWWGSKGRSGWRYLADEDADFRREVLRARGD